MCGDRIMGGEGICLSVSGHGLSVREVLVLEMTSFLKMRYLVTL